MAVYQGPLPVLADGAGSVVPITLQPGNIPAEGLTIDVSRLGQSTTGAQLFGYIQGLTVDATATNSAVNMLSLSFAGGSGLTRNANGGNTQVFKVAGTCQQITIKNLQWTSGPLVIILWNTPPDNETGTPVVQFASGQTITVTAGSVSVTNVAGGQINVAHEAHNVATSSGTLTTGGWGNASGQLIIGASFSGTVRTLEIIVNDVQAFVTQTLVLGFNILPPPGGSGGFGTVTQFGVSGRLQENIVLVSKEVLGVGFVNGLNGYLTNLGSAVVNGSLTVSIGWA